MLEGTILLVINEMLWTEQRNVCYGEVCVYRIFIYMLNNGMKTKD